jgi:hypothetical protein
MKTNGVRAAIRNLKRLFGRRERLTLGLESGAPTTPDTDQVHDLLIKHVLLGSSAEEESAQKRMRDHAKVLLGTPSTAAARQEGKRRIRQLAGVAEDFEFMERRLRALTDHNLVLTAERDELLAGDKGKEHVKTRAERDAYFTQVENARTALDGYGVYEEPLDSRIWQMKSELGGLADRHADQIGLAHRQLDKMRVSRQGTLAERIAKLAARGRRK